MQGARDTACLVVRRAKAPHSSGGQSRPATVVLSGMLSFSLCGVWPQSPYRATRCANLTPHNVSSGPVRGIAAPRTRKQRHGPPRYRHDKPGPTRPSFRRRPRRPWPPSATAALGASRLAPPPVLAESPPNRARYGLE